MAECDRLALEPDNIRAAPAWARAAPPEERQPALERALRLAAASGSARAVTCEPSGEIVSPSHSFRKSALCDRVPGCGAIARMVPDRGTPPGGVHLDTVSRPGSPVA
jgi:hypothetical protein